METITVVPPMPKPWPCEYDHAGLVPAVVVDDEDEWTLAMEISKEWLLKGAAKGDDGPLSVAGRPHDEDEWDLVLMPDDDESIDDHIQGLKRTMAAVLELDKDDYENTQLVIDNGGEG